MCFVTVEFGENESFLINPDCRQLIFMKYLRKKCQYDNHAFIDLIDSSGKLTNIHSVEEQENLRDNFDRALVYIPVLLERDSDEIPHVYKTIKPLLNDWEKKFPSLEKKIKVLTGEVRKRRSPKAADRLSRGAVLDKKPSHNKSGEVSARSSSVMSKQSSGRKSTAGSSGKPENSKKKSSKKK